jgi:hypothetical protein
VRIPLSLTPAGTAATSLSSNPPAPAATDLPFVRVFLAALGILLLGYMFMGRGFAHIGLPPLYIGEMVLALGLAVLAAAAIRFRGSLARWPIEWLLLAFVVLGAIRTIPYIPGYGLDALRDGTLWGYAFFALVISIVADRSVAIRSLAALVLIVPIFAVWLPISWNLFAAASRAIDVSRPGELIPLVFFKGGDMAVHVAAACAVLVLGTAPFRSRTEFLVRAAIGVPLLWTAFVAGTSNRGALLTFLVGIALLALLAGRRRNWLPLGAALVVLVGGLMAPGILSGGSDQGPEPTATPGASPTTLGPTAGDDHSPSPSATPAATRAPAPTSTPGVAGSHLPEDVGSIPDVGGAAVTIANAGFEGGPPNSGRIERWSVSGVGTFNILAGDAHDGERAAVIRTAGNPYETWIKSTKFPFQAGDDIFVAAWFRTVQGAPRLEIYVNWLDVAGKQLASEYLGSVGPSRSRDWQPLYGYLTAPPKAVSAQLLLYQVDGDGTIAIDDVSVRSGDFIVAPPKPKGRPAQLDQFIENILSIFGESSDQNLEGTKQFRLAWWGKIVDYTVFGEYFWTGKGFGVNLADSDGFQSTADHSLRAPHNSHVTVLARMGVPGFAIWVVLQLAFLVALLRALAAHRRSGDRPLAALAACLLVYWLAMMVDTSFDPYLEGPQGGIWFWSVFGMGLVVIRLASRRVAS